MKSILLCLCITLCCRFAQTQSIHPVAIEDPAYQQLLNGRPVPKVTGKLLNISPAEANKLQVNYELRNIFGVVHKTTSVNADGGFQLEFDINYPYQEFFIDIDDFYFGRFFADKDLHIDLDFKKIKKIDGGIEGFQDGAVVSGSDSELNSYLENYQIFRKSDKFPINSKLTEVIGQEIRNPDSVALQFRTASETMKLIEDEYVSKNPSRYSWILENERMSRYYGLISSAYIGHSIPTELFAAVKYHKAFVMSGASSNYYHKQVLMLTYPRRLTLRAPYTELKTQNGLTVEEKNAIEKIDSLITASYKTKQASDSLNKLFEVIKAATMKLMLVKSAKLGIHIVDSLYDGSRADIMKILFNDQKDVVDQKTMLIEILPTLKTDWCIKMATMQYAKNLERIENINKSLATNQSSLLNDTIIVAPDRSELLPMPPGSSSLQQTDYGASFFKISNLNASQFLHKLRTSFPGKALLLDRWATWCAPCIRDMPHGKNLSEAAADLPIVFIYACSAVGSNEVKWKNIIVEAKIPGIHIYIDEKLDASLTQMFNFNAYPGYAFINANGIYLPGAVPSITIIKDRNDLLNLIKR